MINQAILLCAGRGSRLGINTENKPKPLTDVNGDTILENSIKNLIEFGVNRLVIVVGYKNEMIEKVLKEYEDTVDIIVINNKEWDVTNNLYSLYLARQYLKNETLLIEGDIFFDGKILKQVDMEEKNLLLASPLNELMEGAFVTAQNSKVTGFYSTKSNEHHNIDDPLKTLNIYKLSNDLCVYVKTELEKAVSQNKVNIYYETIFKKALKEGFSFEISKVEPELWMEIDDQYDLSLSEYIFSKTPHEQLKSQHGGYWRYPITDHALIYNFHFPPQELKNKMIDRFDNLLLNYPSSSKYFVKHLSKFLKVSEEQLLIANGVSEIIKVLPRIISGKVVLTRPSFNEYFNCFSNEQIINFDILEQNNFELDKEGLISTIKSANAKALVLITPDNPTGKLINKTDIIDIYEETEQIGTNIIVDESFLDFSSKANETLLNELDKYPRIIVLKSMSKTFGIGGIRLGYAATANKELLENLYSEIPIWNINGFAEEFILNLPRYFKEYSKSCNLVRQETDELVNNLSDIKQLKVFSTDSNFILCKIKDCLINSNDFAEKLLINHSIYIKECSGKEMIDSEYFFRVSSRTAKENKELVSAIHYEIQKVAEQRAVLI